MREKSTKKSTVLTNEKGFTLIELIIVIVILGILAVVAVPKYADMQTEAKEAAADGVFGACQGAAAINFAASLTGATQPAGGKILGPKELLAALDGTPEGWVPDGTTTAAHCGASTSGCICLDEDSSGDCTVAADNFIIQVTTVESDAVKVVLTKTW